jgi:hypothetical protein
MNLQHVQKLQGHTNALVHAFLGFRLNYGLLKPLLGNPHEPVDQPPSGVLHTGVSALRNTLFFSCVLDVVKLTWDRDPRPPTIAKLVAALEDPDVVNLVVRQQAAAVAQSREQGDMYQRQWLEQIERDEAERRRLQVVDLLDRLRASWSEFDASSFKDGFLTMRDKHIAHLELRSVGSGYEPVHLGTLGVSPSDLALAVSTMEGIIWNLNAILRDADFQMASATRMFDDQGRKFWKSLTG